ncbi:MAG: hypothetical protein KatS3mg051_1548 [Anaerolineae bacterium]|nr:MAG: hypothetical protein KatS3mg051_1548 [Anaerolineae bacterium]
MPIDPNTTNKITIPMLSEIGRALLDGDQLVGHDGTDMRRINMSRLKQYLNTKGIQYLRLDIDGEAAVTTGSDKIVLYLPQNWDVQLVFASLSTAGTTLTEVDITRNGTSIFGVNKLTIDASENTSVTATTPPDITYPLQADALDRLAVNVLQAGTGAAGLDVWLIGTVRL